MSEPNTISIKKPEFASSNSDNKTIFPTEIVSLPSKGWFYPENSPLSSGRIELKMMTAKEEDILTSKNLIQKNIVLDKLLEAIVVDKNINTDEILLCDRNAIFFAIRRLAYGDEYPIKMKCPKCSEENEVNIDLSIIDNKPFNFEDYTRGLNEFSFVLPFSKIEVTYKILSKVDENIIEREIETGLKISKEYSKQITTRLIHIITSVNGERDKMKIRKFVNEQMLSKDSYALRTHIRNSMPDIDTSFDFTCQACNHSGKEEIPIGINFFWPNGQI